MSPAARADGKLDVFLVAGEASGDMLGAGLMRALTAEREVAFRGIGGPLMGAAGLSSRFPMQDITAIGLAPVLAKLPTIVRRLRETVAAIVEAPPDVLVLIDAPDFTHRVARRVRALRPDLPIVKYVSPTVWIWRPGRAKAMRPNIDLILALLPFEPEVHRQLGGPPCLYVGHPLLEHLAALRPSDEETRARTGETPLVLALPGSRRQEIRRLGATFGAALRVAAKNRAPFEVVLPTLPHILDEVMVATADWPLRPRIVTTEAEKFAAFRRASAALAASGTVTLELALAGIPTVAAYRIPAIEAAIIRAAARIHPVIRTRTAILTNLVLGENVVPEFLQEKCTAQNLGEALAWIMDDTPARQRQTEAFARLDTILGVGEMPPSTIAARAVLDLLAKR